MQRTRCRMSSMFRNWGPLPPPAFMFLNMPSIFARSEWRHGHVSSGTGPLIGLLIDNTMHSSQSQPCAQ